jgi:hypothetical protein
MNWSAIAEATSDILSIVLIVRLLSLRLHHVYRIFCAFLVFDIVSSLIGLGEQLFHNPRFDYRITWISLSIVGWIVSLCLVYGLLQAILGGLPGILRFSRKLLNITFISVLVLSILTIKLDAAVSGTSGYLSGFVDPIGWAVRIAFGLERVVSTVALLVLLVILAFVLWFPVQMPRNLAVFSVGLVIYFAANTGLMLTRGFWSRESLLLVSNLIAFILAACYAYWTIFITREGEVTRVRMGHGWDLVKQERLIGQLEAMNASLVRAARR